MKPGIFCVEGDWWPGAPATGAVTPLLQLLATAEEIPFVRRAVATRADLAAALAEFVAEAGAGLSHPILYLGLHGDAGSLRLDGADLDLEWIGAQLAGRAAGRVIHLSACDTLDAPDERVAALAVATGAVAVSGYGRTVGWIESAAFELLYLAELAGPPSGGRWGRRGLARVERHLAQLAADLSRRLAFRFVVNPQLPVEEEGAPPPVPRFVPGERVTFRDEPAIVIESRIVRGRPRYVVRATSDAPPAVGDLDGGDASGEIVCEEEQLTGGGFAGVSHEAAPLWRVGDVVTARYQGRAYSPCLVTAARLLDGGEPLYDVYFDVDQSTVEGVAPSDILARSSEPLEHF